MPKDDKTRSLAPAMTAEIPIVGTDVSTAQNTPGRHKWQPGESGNPNGRPKALLTTALREAMTPELAAELAGVALDKARRGDFKWYELVFMRLEGKPVERRESGQPGAFDSAIESLETDALLAMIKEIGRRQAQSTPNETQSHDSDVNRT